MNVCIIVYNVADDSDYKYFQKKDYTNPESISLDRIYPEIRCQKSCLFGKYNYKNYTSGQYNLGKPEVFLRKYLMWIMWMLCKDDAHISLTLNLNCFEWARFPPPFQKQWWVVSKTFKYIIIVKRLLPGPYWLQSEGGRI